MPMEKQRQGRRTANPLDQTIVAAAAADRALSTQLVVTHSKPRL